MEKEKKNIQVSNEELIKASSDYTINASTESTIQMASAEGTLKADMAVNNAQSAMLTPARDSIRAFRKKFTKPMNNEHIDFDSILKDIRNGIDLAGANIERINIAFQDLEQSICQDEGEDKVILSKLNTLEKVINSEFPLV